MKTYLLTITAALSWVALAEPRNVGGVYPSLAYFNDEGECGTGAVVPWAGSLWVVTYGPHCPVGSSDRLYQITPAKGLIIRNESVGGTPADRLIHRETNQLLIGPYVIDAKGNVRVVPPTKMPGRLTGAARHLADPANLVYVATMDNGLYTLDMSTLAVKTLQRDHNGVDGKIWGARRRTDFPSLPDWDQAVDNVLPGSHTKGMCSGFGRVQLANNGEYHPKARTDPWIPAGVLGDCAQDGTDQRVIRRCQFTDITTRDGISGNEHPDTNPIWAMGWDAKSVIISVTTDGKKWTDYRLPKGSHSYDGAHGWNTEWPRIREIGDKDTFLATMHGTFWKFPADFRPGNAKGVRPRSNYLKVIGDFCAWNGKVVLGCDDSAKNEFMNKRSVKGTIKGPAKSHSNLRFINESELDRMGPPIGNAIVWNRDDILQNVVSDPYLFAGYEHKWVWVSEGEFEIEIDEYGTGAWKSAGTVRAGGNDLSGWPGEWIRFKATAAHRNTTVAMFFRAKDDRAVDGFDAIPAKRIALGAGEKALLHVNAIDPRALSLSVDGKKGYKLDKELKLSGCPEAAAAVAKDAPLKTGVLKYEASSILYVDDSGNRWRLPYGVKGEERRAKSEEGRVCREVCTERDHFNAGGIYYELPAENAHGFAGLRPVATHNRPIFDYGSWRGLFALSLPGEVRLMAIDDMWKAGKVRGSGGPWKDTAVKAGVPSDAYLMNGFDKKTLTLKVDRTTTVTMEVDVTGWGVWVKAGEYDAIAAGVKYTFVLPQAMSGYWVRFVSSADCTATAQLDYE